MAEDALLLIGHGSARYPEAGALMLRHVPALRGRFAQVEVGLLNGSPSVGDALGRLGGRLGHAVIRVVPFFMEDGYFTQVAVPQAIRNAASLDASGDAALGGRPALLCPAVGLHDAMAGLIERRALAACNAMGVPSRRAAVLVVGHGSSRAPGRALALHRHVSRLAAAPFARVEAACLEEPPFVAEALRGLRAHVVVAIGFFANLGRHVLDDVPRLISQERAGRGDAGPEVRWDGPVSEDPAMVGIILDQAGLGSREV